MTTFYSDIRGRNRGQKLFAQQKKNNFTIRNASNNHCFWHGRGMFLHMGRRSDTTPTPSESTFVQKFPLSK